MWRYSTYAEAERGHQEAITQARIAAAKIKSIADKAGEATVTAKLAHRWIEKPGIAARHCADVHPRGEPVHDYLAAVLVGDPGPRSALTRSFGKWFL
jgi:hypothetical protein